MLEAFKPELISKTAFVKNYSNAKIDLILEHLSWAIQAKRNIYSLNMSLTNKHLQERVWNSISGMQMDLPLGKRADIKLQNLKNRIQKTGYKTADMTDYVTVLNDLEHGYRKFLKERCQEL
jgi:hypothetical protein